MSGIEEILVHSTHDPFFFTAPPGPLPAAATRPPLAGPDSLRPHAPVLADTGSMAGRRGCMLYAAHSLITTIIIITEGIKGIVIFGVMVHAEQ